MKKLIKRIYYWFIVSEGMSYRYSKKWDDFLRSIIDEKMELCGDNYHVTLGGTELWAVNHPYASFIADIDHDLRFRPSREVIYKLGKRVQKLKEESFNQILNEKIRNNEQNRSNKSSN